MIFYLVTERHALPMRYFLESWGAGLVERLKLVTYESILEGRERLPERGGNYIFTNLGSISRMKPDARRAIFDLHHRLVAADGTARVFNDPARSLRRYDLLRRLHEHGVNTFNAYRANEPAVQTRLPAFLRHEFHALFDQLELVRNPEQYAAQQRGIRWRYGSLDNFVAVEFCDTADSSGLYRKYGAFVVGNRIVPRHIFFSRNWHIKTADLAEPTMIEEELDYIVRNPHAAALLECARLAGISYGRIDYGLLGGRPQVWEINTNAALVNPPAGDLPQRSQVHATFAKSFSEAMIALDEGA